MKFKLQSKYKPTGDQPRAIKELVKGLDKGYQDQTLLGVTGSGKTFTVANVIEKIQKPTLIISHNKTLAAQLAEEFRLFFPKNAVHYFVSYYDYYQPEAYIPHTDTYIEKETSINEEIDRLRNAATYALLSRRDVIVVASVSCIYGLGNPAFYKETTLKLKKNESIDRRYLLSRLTSMRYQRNDTTLLRGTFRVHGDVVDIFPSYGKSTMRVQLFGERIEKLLEIDNITGKIIKNFNEFFIYPARHHILPAGEIQPILDKIKIDLAEQIQRFKSQNKLLEAQRIEQRTNFDLEMINETGYCSGIENYSLYFDNRQIGEPPYTLLDYFPKDFQLFIDESHMTVPQIAGMFAGDFARKSTLIEHGFRLPAAYDNRPLKFPEFTKKINQTIYLSATPGKFELSKSEQIVEQIVRPTGLLDPEIDVRTSKGQIDDLISEIKQRTKKHQRVLVTTLTKTLAEDLTNYLKDLDIKVAYIHHEVQTLKRTQILQDLRTGVFDVLVGINLLREGLDLPEVSLVAILDADKEGFLRSDWALIQVIGRAARHLDGKAILYADKKTISMQKAIAESKRRRKIQEAYNQKHNITPTSIKKKISQMSIVPGQDKNKEIDKIKLEGKNKIEKSEIINDLEAQMELAAKNLEFEKAAILRDQIKAFKNKTR